MEQMAIQSFGLLQAQEIMSALSDRDTIRAFAAPAVHVNRQITRRLRRSTQFKDRTKLLRTGLSARQTPLRYARVRGDNDATRLSTIYSRSPVINILEGGTRQRRTRSYRRRAGAGRNTGKVPPLRIVQTVLNQTQDGEIEQQYGTYLNGPQGFEKIIRRAAARKPRRDP